MKNKIVIICSSARFWDKIREEKITLCGDNCLECPRYHAHTEEELKRAFFEKEQNLQK